MIETDKQGGFKLSLQEELKTGVHRSLFARSVPMWARGENIQFTNFGVRKLRGWDSLAVTGNNEPIRGILQQAESGSPVAYFGDLTTLYRTVIPTGSVTDIGDGYSLPLNAGSSAWDAGGSVWDGGSTVYDFGIVRAGMWSMIDYGTFVLATNGFDSPQIKKTEGRFVSMVGAVTYADIDAPGSGYVEGDVITLTGGDGTGATMTVLSVNGSGAVTSLGMLDGGSLYTTPPTGASGGTGTGLTITAASVTNMDIITAEIFQKRGPHVLAFNTSASSREVVWCDADNLDDWITTSSNLAGALEIRELKGPIRAAVPLGSRIAIYGDDQVFLLSYLGNELVFGYQPAMNGLGAVSKASVIPVGPRNFGLSRQGFFVTDGSTFQYIDDAIRYWFQNNAASSQLSKAIAYHDELNTEVRWHFPADNIGRNVGVAYNYQLGVWSFLSDDKSAGEERTVAGYAITGDSTGRLYAENLTDNAAGAAMPAFVRSKPMDLGSADRVKELDSIRLGFTGTGLHYRVGWSDTEDGEIIWNDYQLMDSGFPFKNVRTAGRWLHIEIYSNDLNTDWELMAVEIIGRIEGTR